MSEEDEDVKEIKVLLSKPGFMVIQHFKSNESWSEPVLVGDEDTVRKLLSGHGGGPLTDLCNCTEQGAGPVHETSRECVEALLQEAEDLKERETDELYATIGELAGQISLLKDQLKAVEGSADYLDRDN